MNKIEYFNLEKQLQAPKVSFITICIYFFFIIFIFCTVKKVTFWDYMGSAAMQNLGSFLYLVVFK